MFRLLQNASKSHFRRWRLALLCAAIGSLSLLAWQHSQATGQSQTKPTLGNATSAANAQPAVNAYAAAVAAARREDLQQCTINCGATVPATGTAGQAVAFTASAPTTGCTTQPTYLWDFGDGSPTSNQQNPSKTYAAAGPYNWRLTTTVGSGGTNIDTIVGGLGEGAPARQSPYLTPYAVAADVQNRGVFVMESAANGTVLRFINTTNQPVTLGGRVIEAGTNRTLVGGGTDELGENLAGRHVSLADAYGLAVHPNGNLVYFVVSNPARVRALNLSASNQTVGTRTVAPGNVATLAEIAGTDTLNALAVNSTGDVFVASPATGVNRVYRINANGQVANFAGNGASTQREDAFTPGPATSVPLLQPRALEVDPNNNVYIADASHQRVIRVDPGGAATLVTQFAVPMQGQGSYPAGLAYFSGSLYVALGNAQTIVRVAAGQQPVRIAGTENKSCDYSTSNCGDGGTIASAEFFMQGSSGNPPFAHIDAHANGLLIPDQGSISRGRIRYLNLSSGPVTLAGTTIAAMNINTMAGNGLLSPYDGVVANAAELRITNGLAVDANNNLWLADSSIGRLRFVNRSAANVTLFPNTPAAQQIVPPGAIVTVNKDVGGGIGDDTTANLMSLNTPQGLYATSQGLYIVETLGAGPVGAGTAARKTGRIRFLNTTGSSVTIFPQASTPLVVPAGNVKTIVGGGQDPANIGNGGFALNAKLLGPSDIVVTSSGDIYIADTGNKTVRKVLGTTGIVSGLTLTASDYIGLALDSTGRLYIADNDGNRVLRENGVNNGNFTSITSETTIYRPRDIVVDNSGNVYVLNAASVFADTNINAHRIMRVTPGGTTSVYAGTTNGFSGDGGPATAAQMSIYSSPVNLLTIGSSASGLADTTINMAITGTGEILFSDIGNFLIRRLASGEVTCTRTGTITIMGGCGNAPTLAALTPAVRGAGTGAFTLTVTGGNFTQSAVVRLNGQDRATTFVNATQLTAQVLASDVVNAGMIPVTVFIPAPCNLTSSPMNLNVQPVNLVPVINNILPGTIAVNTPFRLTVNGSNFTSASVIRWENQPRPTTFVNDGQLTAQIPTTDLGTAGPFEVSVFTPEPGGGVSTNSRFIVTNTNAVPALSVLSPGGAQAGGQAFTLTLNGTGFAFNSVVRWGGQNRTTNYLSPTQLTIQVPAADIANTGAVPITVFSPLPGGGVTAAYNFVIGTPATGVSAASYAPNLAPESIVALFGVGLATGVKVADTVPLPTTLEGTTISVRDSTGNERPAPLFFVAPQQINFQIPAGTALGQATLIIRAGDGKMSVAMPNIAAIQPGLFTANASGTGPASAVVLRIKQDNSLVYEDTVRFENGQPVPIPIDLGPETDRVFIIAYGTGIRGNDTARPDSASFGGQSIEALYGGPQGVLIGLDQVNLGPIPRNIGRGPLNLIFTLDGVTSNTVQLTMK
jgi:uncharacterized protein (TIGR03437 family)